MNKRILILATHPDDECLSFGGLMSKALRHGDQIFIHTFCVGGPCSNVATEIREKELVESTLLYNALVTWDTGLDGLLSTVPNNEITTKIDNLIETIKPDEVYCNADSEHMDHHALYTAFLAAARVKEKFTPKLFAIGTYPFSDQLYPQPQGGKIYQPMTEEDLMTKIEAFHRHKSQNKPAPSLLGDDSIITQAKYYGMMCGHKYAELYYQLKYVRDL